MHGLEAPPKDPRNTVTFEDHIKKLAPTLTDQQLAQIPVACALFDGIIDDPSYVTDDGKSFDVLLGVHKNVDRKKSQEEAQWVLASKRPKPPKPVEEPKKKAKAKAKK